VTLIRGKKSIFALLILLALVLLFLLWRQQKAAHETKYQSFTVERGDLQITILSTGTVQPENKLDIKPPVAGRIESVLIQEGDVVKRGQIIAWMSSTERAALLDAARARGPGELKRWEDLYKATPIIAPINGTIILRNAEAGQTVAATDAPFTMSDRLTVKALVDETDIAQIKLKQKALITLDAYPKEEIPAKVDQIAYDAKTTNNVTTYSVDVLPDQTPEFMRSGMTANVTFEVEEKKDVLLIPSEAIKVRNGQMVATVRTAENIETREIHVGASDGKKTEVLSGLQEGETVVVPKPKEFSDNEASNPFSPFGKKRGGGKKSRGGH
jgi:macrolide-specific efflux system membrane fusion protein